jgi:cytochrome c biogenesis protein
MVVILENQDNKQAVEQAKTEAPAGALQAKKKAEFSPFASVQFSIFLMALMAATVLIGAWCPQEPAVGQEKVFEAFDRPLAEFLIRSGVSDIFHSPWFMFLVAMLTLNMIIVSCQRVFPKAKLINQKLPYVTASGIERMPVHFKVQSKDAAGRAGLLAGLSAALTKMGYKVEIEGERLRGEYGKYSRLAATVTHIGLLSLLAGITITSWTGFNGFEPTLLDQNMTFDGAKRAKLWVGHIPDWHVRVDASRRENYPSGDPKQYYSTLTVVSPQGKELAKKEISVNEPLTYESVDIYQSTWGLEKLDVSFNDHKLTLPLRSMGKRYAAFMPLNKDTILILSLPTEGDKLRVFAKTPEQQAPKLITEVKAGQSVDLGGVKMTFNRVVPITGLQYKCDPGLPLTYLAFGIIMLGVSLAAIPHRHIWAAFSSEKENSPQNNVGALVFGGTSKKAKVGFEKGLEKLRDKLANSGSVS